MDQIYPLDNGNKLILYTNGHYIYLHTLPLNPSAKPMIIATDYEDMFFSCEYQDTIYFIYRNQSHNLILGTLTDKQRTTVLNDEALLFSPSVHALFPLSKDTLTLLITLKNPLNAQHCLKLMFPLSEQPPVTILDDYDTSSTVLWIPSADSGFLLILQGENYTLRKLSGDGTHLISCTPPAPDLSGACENCAKLQEQITEITKQYNQLAETTRKIQEEGKYWKRLYEERSHFTTGNKPR